MNNDQLWADDEKQNGRSRKENVERWKDTPLQYKQEWKEDFLSAKQVGVPVGVSEDKGEWPKWTAAHALE